MKPHRQGWRRPRTKTGRRRVRRRDLLYGHAIRFILPTVHPDEAEKRRNETADDRGDERRERGSQSPFFLNLLESRSRGPGAEFVDGPSVYLPPAALLHKVPSPLVMLDLPGQRGLGFARDGCRVARDLGVRPLDEHYALHLVEGALKGGPIRKPPLPPALAEKAGGRIVISLRGFRIERLHRLLRRLGRKHAPFRYVTRRSRRGRTL